MLRLPVLALLILGVTSDTKDPNFAAGRSTFVHLFEWTWPDIAQECEDFLGPIGYGGVQVSPANENGIIWQPFWDQRVKRPWYERYQPVSYKIATRSGNENQFKDMVDRCNKAGVRIYVDTVMNHMTGHIGNGRGTGGSYFEPDKMRYDGVPYGPLDFTPRNRCNSRNGDIEDYNDANQVRNCKLSGLNDLDLGKDYVRNKVSEYLNKLISFGVAGFRIDAAKHMWPGDLEALYNRLNNLNQTYFGPNKRPFIFQEVIDMGGEPIKANDYTHLGRVTEFKYGKNLGGFGSILTHFEAKMYKMATAFMLASPYAVTRVMSSFAWSRNIQNGKDVNDWIGPPHDENYATKPVIRNRDLTCGNGWICEHRWRQIYNMAVFRNTAGFTGTNDWWDNGEDQIAFGRGDRAFIAINNDWRRMEVTLQTGLPPGSYCDVISGNKNKQGTGCTGKRIEVGNDRKALFRIEANEEDPVIAIHVQEKL